MVKTSSPANVADPITSMTKFKIGLAHLQNGDPIKDVVGPDGIRDASINIDNRKVFADETLGDGSKNRTSANALITPGGHGAIGAISAAVLRGDENVDILLVAKVFESTRDEVLKTLIGNTISIKGGNPINTDYVMNDRRPGTPINIVFESPDHTSIAVVKGQPVLQTSDYGDQLESLVGEFQKADVTGILSLKSPFMREMTKLFHDRNIRPKELVSDVTTGDDTSVMVETLKLIGHGNHGSIVPPITLLSMNDEEAVRYAKIVWTMEQFPGAVESFLKSEPYATARKELSDSVTNLSALEAQARPEEELRKLRDRIRHCEDTVRECSKKFESGIAQDMEKEWKADFFQAAEYLAQHLQVPLFFHCAQGSQIFDANGLGRSTRFVPSISLKPTAGTLGAGDTMLGAIMLAIGVKNRLDADKTVPQELKLSYEDCLMIANVVTGYRLVHGKVPGTLDECFRWASSPTAEVTPAPKLWSGKKAALEAALAQKQMRLMQRAREEGFSGKATDEARKKIGPYIVGAFKQEGLRDSLEPEQAARELLAIIGGADRTASALAVNSLRELVKKQPSLKGFMRNELGIGSMRLAIMFDLDATLFDSEAARERSGAKAIMKMGLKMGLDNETALDYASAKKLFTALYNRHDDFTAMGFPDFRQVWNSPQMYAAAAAIVCAGGKNGKPVNGKEELLALIKQFENPDATPLLDESYAKLLANKINQVMNSGSYTKCINEATQEYVKTGLVPYLDARRTLSILKEILGAECYVVTEGNDDVQKQKISMLGLSEFFGEGDRVLSTGYAKAPWREVAGLNIERERLAKAHLASLERLAAALQKSLEMRGNSQDARGVMVAEKELLAAKREIATYREEQEVLDWVNSIFTLKAKKGTAGAFYSEVLRAINKTSDNPREAMGAGDHSGGNSAPFLGVMIGDRIDYDIVAMEMVSREVIPIIIKKGQYLPNYNQAVVAFSSLRKALETQAWEDTAPIRAELDGLLKVSGFASFEDYERIMPKLEADTLSDVARYLLSKKTYENAQLVSQPKKVQVESYSEADFEKVMIGRLSPSKAVKLVCEDVLKAIAFGLEDDVCRAVGHFLPHLDSEHLAESHPNRQKSQIKVSAAENLAILLESCPNQTPKIAEAAKEAASKLAEAFSSKSEDPDVRSQFVIAYGRISDDNGPILELLSESAMELGMPLMNALEATNVKIMKTVRLKQDMANSTKASLENYRLAVGKIIKDMNLAAHKGDPQFSGIRSQVAAMYWAGKRAKS